MVFLALYRNFGAIDQQQLPAWLLTVVRNRARDLWRHQVVEQRYVEQSVDPAAAEPSEPSVPDSVDGSPSIAPVSGCGTATACRARRSRARPG